LGALPVPAIRKNYPCVWLGVGASCVGLGWTPPHGYLDVIEVGWIGSAKEYSPNMRVRPIPRKTTDGANLLQRTHFSRRPMTETDGDCDDGRWRMRGSGGRAPAQRRRGEGGRPAHGGSEPRRRHGPWRQRPLAPAAVRSRGGGGGREPRQWRPRASAAMRACRGGARGSSSGRAKMNSHGGGNSEPRHRHEPRWRRRPQAPTASSSGGASLREWGTRRQPVQSRAGLPWWRRACAVASPGYRRRRRRGLMGVAVLCVGGLLGRRGHGGCRSGRLQGHEGP